MDRRSERFGGLNMSNKNIPYDSTASESVQRFSRELNNLIYQAVQSELSANILYVIFQFHSAQFLDHITQEAMQKVKQRNADDHAADSSRV